MLTVTYIYRNPRENYFSIEGIFQLVANCLKGKIEIKTFFCNNQFSKFQNILIARKTLKSGINHITGDVYYIAIGLKGRKNILTYHDLGHYENLLNANKLKAFIYKTIWIDLPLNNAAIVTVVSEFTKEKLLRYTHFPENKIRVVKDPIKPVFKFVKKEKLNNPFRILQIGTGPHKNLKTLIEVAKSTNYHLDIIGNPNRMDLENLKNNGNSYTIYKNLSDEDVWQVYVNCDILYFASFHEGFGMPIIEAQAVGRPVITSNFGAMKEVGENYAILVDPNNVQEIKNAVETLIRDADFYNKYVQLGLKNAAQYHYETIAEQYLKVYQELE